jgi:hypothetical protein
VLVAEESLQFDRPDAAGMPDSQREELQKEEQRVHIGLHPERVADHGEPDPLRLEPLGQDRDEIFDEDLARKVAGGLQPFDLAGQDRELRDKKAGIVRDRPLQPGAVCGVEIGKHLETVRAQAEAGQRNAHALDGGAQQALPATERVRLPADVLTGQHKRPGQPRQVREQPDAAAQDAALQSRAHERDAAVALARLLMTHAPLPQHQKGILDGSRCNQQVQRTTDPSPGLSNPPRQGCRYDARPVVTDENALEEVRIASRRTWRLRSLNPPPWQRRARAIS